MDELVIGDKTFISSKKAAALTGYAKDYIGQLCREGRVEAKLVGRSWYVYEPSIKKHRFKDEEAPLEAGEEKVEVTEAKKEEDLTEKPNNEAVWKPVQYTSETVSVLPDLAAKPEVEEPILAAENTESPTKATEMQSAWQEWFKKTQEPVKSEEVTPPPPTQEPSQSFYSAPREVVMAHVVHDIQPQTAKSFTPRTAPQKHYQTVAGREARPAKREAAGNPIVGAILIAIMIISISLATVVSGAAEKYVNGGPLSGLIDFLGGTSSVKK